MSQFLSPENSPSETGFLSILKAETANQHALLEQLPLSITIVSDNLTLSVYQKYLRAMYDVHHDGELNIYPLIKNEIPDIHLRCKTNLLLDDLNNTGDHYKGCNALPLTSNDFHISSAQAMGVFYVLEGSTLGGRFILKNVKKQTGYDEANGASYFAGYGNETGSYWKRFLEILSMYQNKNNTGDEIIAGAQKAFSRIHNYFRKLG